MVQARPTTRATRPAVLINPTTQKTLRSPLLEQHKDATMLIRSLADPEEGAYRVALRAYEDATERAHRLDGAQHGRPLDAIAFNRDQTDLLHERDDAWRVVGQWERTWSRPPPAAATPWWPGAWLGVSDTRRFGCSGLPGQLDGLNVWPTEAAAHAGRPEQVSASEWTVTWTPTARNDVPEIPLDQAFWAEHSETSPPAPGKTQ
jgi:hypothetical protein